MTLEKIISELHYTNRVKQDVLWKIRRDEKLIDELAKTAYQSDSFDFPLCKRMPLTRLSVVTYLLIRKYGEYKKARIPDQVIFDTFGDVSLRAALYYKKAGKAGISKEDVIWFRHIMNVAIFSKAQIYAPNRSISLSKWQKNFSRNIFRKSNIKRSCVIAGCCIRPCRCISPAIQISDSSPVVSALSGIALIRRRQKSFFLLTEQERRLPQKRPPCKCWHSLTRKSLAMLAAL